MTLITQLGDAEVIDIHAHLAPEELVYELAKPGGVSGVHLDTEGEARRIIVGGRPGARLDSSMYDLAARLDFLERKNIDRQIVSPWVELLAYELPGDQGEQFSRHVNRSMARATAAHGGRLSALGTVPLQCGGEVAARVLREGVEELGLLGVQIGTHVPASGLSDDRLIPFWAEAERLRAIVFVHPHYANELRPGMAPVLEYAIANPADTTLAIAQLMFSGRLAAFPELSIVLSHGGGFLPYQLGRLESAWSRAGRHDEPGPRELFARLHSDTIVHGDLALDFLIASSGSERVLMGTDYPFALGDLAPMNSLARSSSDSDAFRRILSLNARSLMASVRNGKM